VKRKVICLTPVKNESWILERFLKCTSLWADHIIIADQNSDDGSEEIAKSFQKVIYVKNSASQFNEPERQKLLINEARKISGEKVLVALDADEALTGNFLNSPEWESMLTAPKGTVVRFQWINLCDDMENCWVPHHRHPFGFVDDGSEHSGLEIHSPRVPVPFGSPSLLMNQIKVLHYQCTDQNRMKSKHRWYQVWERANRGIDSSVALYRQYNHMNAVLQSDIKKIDQKWFDDYELNQIDMKSIICDEVYRWDFEVLNEMEKHGVDMFRNVPIWDVDWSVRAQNLKFKDFSNYRDPRSNFKKLLHHWLHYSQPIASRLTIRVIDECLKLFKL